MSQVQQKFGCVDRKDGTAMHQMQLWMEYRPEHGADKAFRFVVRNVDLGSGGRRCELEAGSYASYAEALAAGRKAMPASKSQAPLAWVVAAVVGLAAVSFAAYCLIGV